ncbi:hypothetical protein HK104_001755 [Borealophlyctis nickersoniae]|nr:hypothetical protein HK104_001755 [Borealophlyctis nickersoniae]
MTDSSKEQDEMSLIGMEAVVSIINFSIRKQILRSRLMNKMTDEKELSSSMQHHRDEFSQFIWKRRMAARKDMRMLFQAGPGMICRFGDTIGDSTLEALQAFEKNNWARLCRDGIQWGLVGADDIPTYFLRKIYLVAPRVRTGFKISANRLEMTLGADTKDLFADMQNPPPTPPEWECAYATAGPWLNRLMARPTVCELVLRTLAQLESQVSSPVADELSYVHLLARVIDAVHPTHQLQASVLAYPLSGVSILKRRLISLGYNVGPGGEESTTLDAKTAVSIVKEISMRLETEHRFYFEFSAPDKTPWRVGFVSAKYMLEDDHNGYPGQDEFSVGFSHDGTVHWNGKRRSYTNKPDDSLFFMGTRTFGVLTDLYAGTIRLVIDGKLQTVAFGAGASAFKESQQEEQWNLIMTSQLIPMLALSDANASQYSEKPQIRVNFGDLPFSYSVAALPCNAILQFQPSKCKLERMPKRFQKQADELYDVALDTISVIDGDIDGRESINDEEEEKLNLVLVMRKWFDLLRIYFKIVEKNTLRVSLIPEPLKSFSQFPPSIYRRSLACTRIQRVWRRFRGRRIRNKIREEQYVAATLIQMMARKKLRKIRALKNDAAAKIQKNWRRKKFIWLALLRCIYQQPIPELHRAATVIQRKWRHWAMFRNSPIASKYNARIEDILHAISVIIAWWRPLYKRFSEVKRLREKHEAATNIQRVWRGYYLRQLLRPDLRRKLRDLGESVARHRQELLRIRGAYILQNAWRTYVIKRVRADKLRTRNRAAARIQAFWKGYWVRSHIHLRFTYGEAVFLTAVCKALRNCHFILKMYKPCGIVCPRREVSYSREGEKINRS